MSDDARQDAGDPGPTSEEEPQDADADEPRFDLPRGDIESEAERGGETPDTE